MAELYKTTSVWVIDFRYDGHPRRWLRTYAATVDVPAAAAQELRALHGPRARLVEARRATADEELQYLRGENPVNPVCPTLRAGRRGGGSSGGSSR